MTKVSKEVSMNSQKLLTIEELSSYLSVSKHTIYSWVRRDKIPHIKINGCVRFRTNAIDEWLKENESKPKEEGDD